MGEITDFFSTLFGSNYSEEQKRMLGIQAEAAQLQLEDMRRRLPEMSGVRSDALAMIMGNAQDVGGRSRGRIQSRPFNPFGPMRDVQTFGTNYPTPSTYDVGPAWFFDDDTVDDTGASPGPDALDVNPYTQIGLGNMGFNPYLTRIEDGPYDEMGRLSMLPSLTVRDEENPYEVLQGIMGYNPSLTSRVENPYEVLQGIMGYNPSLTSRVENPYELIGTMGLNPSLQQHDEDGSPYGAGGRMVTPPSLYQQDGGENPYEVLQGIMGGTKPAIEDDNTSRSLSDYYSMASKPPKIEEGGGTNPYEALQGIMGGTRPPSIQDDPAAGLATWRAAMAAQSPELTGIEGYLDAVMGAEQIAPPRDTARPQQEWLQDFIEEHGDYGLAQLRKINDPSVLEAIRSGSMSLPPGFQFSETGVLQPSGGDIDWREYSTWVQALPPNLYAMMLGPVSMDGSGMGVIS